MGGGKDARCEEVWVFVTERGWRCKWCLLFVSPDAKVWIIRFQGLDGHGLGKEEEQRGVTGVAGVVSVW